jgi:AraC-like DNA-binding protein/quercetin dioxygenase-like cupin family protein
VCWKHRNKAGSFARLALCVAFVCHANVLDLCVRLAFTEVVFVNLSMSKQLTVKDKIEIEMLIKITSFKKGIRTTLPHKHNNYFEIVYLSQGSGYHYIDLNKYSITPPVMFFVRQEQVHYWEINTEPEGYVVIIRKSFIEKSLDSELKSLLTKISSECCLQLSDTSTIEKLLALLTEENNTRGISSLHVTEGLLKSLLAKVLEVSKPITNKQDHKSDLFQAFIQLLSADNGIKNKVAYYAKKLNTTPQNINAACQKSIQKPAAEILAEFVLNEAKRLLLYTGKTVSEISFALEFTDPSHFVKYFKKIVGCTPQSFRQESS